MNHDESIRNEADRITAMILYGDYPWIDIEIEINKLREKCCQQFPEKAEFFEQLYHARFNRLKQQWYMK